MRHITYLLGAALIGAAFAAPAAAQDPKPFPGTGGEVFLYVDLVNGTARPPAKARPKSCTQLSAFKRAERVVFRVWGAEAETGAPLTTENVKYAYVKIPGQPNIKLNWGPHGSGTGRSLFWTAGWTVPLDYPLGVVAFRVVFKTESDVFGIFTQDGLPQESRLTILPQ